MESQIVSTSYCELSGLYFSVLVFQIKKILKTNVYVTVKKTHMQHAYFISLNKIGFSYNLFDWYCR